MMTAADDIVRDLRRGLVALAVPAKAATMQAYMKSTMPYLGVLTPARRRLTRQVLDQRPPTDRATWEAVVDELWDGATHREERYVAVDVSGHSSARTWQDLAAVDRYEHMIVTGAWWDHVDAVAIGLVGPIVRADARAMTPRMQRWARDPDRWRRRASIIVQVGSGRAFDTDLLGEAVLANAGDQDFFIRKAIGWVLRDVARTDPRWVRQFVDEHDRRLSALSLREATKHL